MDSQFKTLEKFSISEDLSAKGPADKNCLTQLAQEHPLSQVELNYNDRMQNIHFRKLRNREGLAGPIKLSMEMKIVQKCGGRLPFLSSSNVHLDVLRGRDELIEFPDFLGVEENHEVLRQPHAVMEKSLGIL